MGMVARSGTQECDVRHEGGAAGSGAYRKVKMLGAGFNTSELHPSVFWHSGRQLTAVILVDDFMCIGLPGYLQWLLESLKEEYDLKKHVLDPWSAEEVLYLHRVPRKGSSGGRRGVFPEASEEYGIVDAREGGGHEQRLTCKAHGRRASSLGPFE